MAVSTVNDTMRQIMASVRAWFEDAQWVNLGLTPTRLSGTSFSLSGDVTATFHVGRRIKATGSATGYATITASSYGAPNTSVTVTMDSGSLPVTLSAVYLSILSSANTAVPTQANPSWTGAASGGSLALSTPLPVTSGGTGASTVAAARSALSVSASGSDTTYSFRANNLSDLASAVSARSNLGLVIGSDIPAVNGSGASGTWNISISGNAATATNATTAANVTGPVAVANGGTSATTAANARSNLGLVIGSDVPSPSGSGASGTWGINVSGNAATATSATTATTAGNVSGTVAVLNGGTGSTTASGARTNLGLATVAATGSAADLGSGTLPDARIQASGVTQHQASLTILETQITDGALLARVGGNETISGTWSFSNATASAGVTNSARELWTGVVSPAQITSSQNDYNPGITGCNILRLSTNSAGLNITGLIAGTAGQVMVLFNIGANNFNLIEESASSSAANRFNTPGASGVGVATGDSIILWYDGTSSRWRCVGPN